MRHGKPNVIIVGGGVAGLSAAHALDQLDIGVHLIEKQAGLGGHAFNWACMATKSCNRCSACAVSDRIHRVVSHPGIDVRTLARLVDLQGEDGNFQARIETVDVPDRPICRSHPHFVLGASETLEQASADFALAQLARRLGDSERHRLLLERSANWRNLFNPQAIGELGYIQGRNADGS